MFWTNPPFEPEPLTVALGLIATASSAILRQYEDKLEVEKFSIADALAVGYVNNFIEPLVTQLIKNDQIALLHIFIPVKLSDLEPKNVDRLLSELKERELSNKTVNVELDEGRGVRDVLSVFNTRGDNIYFDFPNTLLTLNPLINYKVESRRNSFNEDKKATLGKLYIAKFQETVENLLKEKNLYPKYVKFSNSFDEIQL